MPFDQPRIGVPDGSRSRANTCIHSKAHSSSKTRKEPEMAEKLEDLGIPMKPARGPVPPTIPARIADLSRPSASGNEPNKVPDSPPSTPGTDQAERRTMIVGREISLSGDIRSCNRLVVEGSVEATLNDCREMEIAESGFFKGNASIEQAEGGCPFVGEHAVRQP